MVSHCPASRSDAILIAGIPRLNLVIQDVGVNAAILAGVVSAEDADLASAEAGLWLGHFFDSLSLLLVSQLYTPRQVLSRDFRTNFRESRDFPHP